MRLDVIEFSAAQPDREAPPPQEIARRPTSENWNADPPLCLFEKNTAPPPRAVGGGHLEL